MNRHLSPEEISAWTIGERPSDRERHISECPQCRAQLDHLALALSQFRTALRDTSAQVVGPATWCAPVPPHRTRTRWLLLATAAVILLVSGSAYWNITARRRAAEITRADALLLEQVDAGISRAVPEPMEPLVQLVSWGPGPTTKNQKEIR